MINVLTLIVGAIILIYVIYGIKKGFVDGIVHIIGSILGWLVLLIIVKTVGSAIQGNYENILIALILLLAIHIINKILKFITDTLEIASKVIILKWVDHLLGIVTGLIRGVILVWFLFIFVGFFNIMDLNSWIMKQVTQNAYINLIYEKNLLVNLLLLLQ